MINNDLVTKFIELCEGYLLATPRALPMREIFESMSEKGHKEHALILADKLHKAHIDSSFILTWVRLMLHCGLPA
jgi:hypothetical protein